MWIVSRRCLLLVLLLCSGTSAQQTTSPSVRQPTPSPTPGTTLDDDIRDFRFEALKAGVASMPPGPDRDYFSGVLANRSNRISESVELLEKITPALEKTNGRRVAVALQTLADDYIKSYRYREAIQAYSTLLSQYKDQLQANELQEIEDDFATVKLLKDAPRQTASVSDPLRIPIRQSPIGSFDAELIVNGVTASWMLDTGANFSVVSASFARRLGLKLSAGEARTQGITGVENRLRIAVLPQLQLGSATVRNVVLLVLDDKSLDVPVGPVKHYKIDALVGYPVFQALGTIRFTSNLQFQAGPSLAAPAAGAPLFMNHLTPLVEASVEGRPVLFSLDTGANASNFSVRYYREFPSAFRGLRLETFHMSGAGGMKAITGYYLPNATLKLGHTEVELHRVSVVPTETNTDMDKVYGNLGRNLVEGFSSFTIDFVNMRFSLGERLAPPHQNQ